MGKREKETELRLEEEEKLSSSLSGLLCWAAFTLNSPWSLRFVYLCRCAVSV